LATVFPVGSAVPVLIQVITALAVLCWVAAIALAIWGSIRDAREAEREARQELWQNPEPTPTPGIEGILSRWTLWSFVLLGAGMLLLVVAVQAARQGY
jgi:preprotein translocase subunit SecG